MLFELTEVGRILMRMRAQMRAIFYRIINPKLGEEPIFLNPFIFYMDIIDKITNFYRTEKALFFAFILLFVPATIMVVVILIQMIGQIYFGWGYFNPNTEDFMKLFFPMSMSMVVGMAIFMFKMGPRSRYSKPDSRLPTGKPEKPIQEQKTSEPIVYIPPILTDQTKVARDLVEYRENTLTPIPLKENINSVKENLTDLGINPIFTMEDTIYRSISARLNSIKNQEKWRSFLPISISLLVTLIVVKFDDKWTNFGLNGSQWWAVFVVVFLSMVMYMGYLIFLSIKNQSSIDDIIDDIKKRSL